MAKFHELFDQEFGSKPHGESISNEQIHSEGIVDNIVDWVKGKKVVAYSRFKYMNQFCKSFEDSKVNHGLWGFFMPKSEGYVSKLGMYALGKSASQAMNNLVKSIKLEMKGEPKKMNNLGYGHDYDSGTSFNTESFDPDVKKVDQVISDFESFRKTIDRNAAVMDPEPQPIELSDCKAIVRVLHRLEGVDHRDWLAPIENAKDDMKDDSNFFEFKEKIRPLEKLAKDMEDFRKKWVRFILDEVRFEEVKTRGADTATEAYEDSIVDDTEEGDKIYIDVKGAKLEPDTSAEDEKQLEIAIEQFVSCAEEADLIDTAIARNQDILYRAKQAMNGQAIAIAAPTAFLEEYNALRTDCMLVMYNHSISLESGGDPKTQLASFIVNLESAMDKIKDAGKWVWEKLKQLWEKIKGFFAKVFGNKKKEIEAKQAAVAAGEDGSKKVVADEMKKQKSTNAKETINEATKMTEGNKKEMEKLKSTLPTLADAIADSFADVADGLQEVRALREKQESQQKEADARVTEKKLEYNKINITPQIQEFLRADNIAKFTSVSDDGLSIYTYKFVLSENGKDIDIVESVEPLAKGKLTSGMSAEEQQDMFYKEADGWIKVNDKSVLKDLLDKKYVVAEYAETTFDNFKSRVDNLISKTESKDKGGSAGKQLNKLVSNAGKMIKTALKGL